MINITSQVFSFCNQEVKDYTMTSLPQEIIFGEILPRVPAKSLVRLKCVCKLWYDTIADVNFVQAHLHIWKSQAPGKILTHSSGNRQKFSYLDSESNEEFDLRFGKCLEEEDSFLSLRASCDGMLLVHVERIFEPGYYRYYYVCNPIIRCSRKLPIPPSQWFGASGLVYDTTIQQYKAVGWFDFGNNVCKCMVFTLTDHSCCYDGSFRSWRELALPKGCRLHRFSHPASARGGLHWVAFNYELNTPCIISVDVTREEFKEIKLPKFESCDQTTVTLVGLQESLYLANSSFIPNTYQLGSTSVWVLGDDDDDSDSVKHHQVWTKLCNIECDDCDGGLKVDKVVSYDTSMLLDVWSMVINTDRERCMGSFSEIHVNSLVSWDGCVKKH